MDGHRPGSARRHEAESELVKSGRNAGEEDTGKVAYGDECCWEERNVCEGVTEEGRGQGYW
ncbi:hypothetical protein BC938DRAFT_471125 [Jimgerdemannia flammicorona]|uniref:Uncharacterized protein n=1 Tax=Jimgerdemannia flammicorona TaxID=994334 RepID=A0A433QUS9_9FUNG|nr:hypothetical protein BC938DRAFT_471125 [Jimgerdemannia flammicorona]